MVRRAEINDRPVAFHVTTEDYPRGWLVFATTADGARSVASIFDGRFNWRDWTVKREPGYDEFYPGSGECLLPDNKDLPGGAPPFYTDPDAVIEEFGPVCGAGGCAVVDLIPIAMLIILVLGVPTWIIARYGEVFTALCVLGYSAPCAGAGFLAAGGGW